VNPLRRLAELVAGEDQHRRQGGERDHVDQILGQNRKRIRKIAL
jgi:hypothetical protein